MKKRFFVLFFAIVLCLTGCSGSSTEDDGKTTVSCSIFPIYDWTVNLTAGDDNIDVNLLVNNGTDMHSFKPTAEDVMNVVESDIVIYVGGESDEWLREVLEKNPKDGREEICLMDSLQMQLLDEEIVEGMQEEHEHNHEEAAEEHEHEGEYDEHIWMSLEMARKSIDIIHDELSSIENTDTLELNYQNYSNSLDTLNEQYIEMVTSAKENLIIVTDRFPFRYLCDEYDIDYYAAFPGCSSESNADFETIVFLAEQLKEKDIDAVVVTESDSANISQAVIEASEKTDVEVLRIDSLQTVDYGDIENGAHYIDIMRSNMEQLRSALN